MALFEDNQPPSPEAEDESIKRDKYLRLIEGLFAKVIFSDKLKRKIGRFFSGANVFLTSNRYLSHITLIILGLVVTSANVSQKFAAKAYDAQAVSINPYTLYSVSQSVDYYTTQIKDDSSSVEKVILAYASPDGFASSSASIVTQVTDRALPVPPEEDNSNKTIKYTIQNGDTLTALGWKYEVKLATLKYVNNIDDENLIKPGMTIKIPQRGYEVSGTLIAKKEAEKKAKLAANSRNTSIRSASSSRTPTVRVSAGSKNNAYPYGWCTYYVATRRSVPGGWGDAKAWLSSAKRSGYSTGKSPSAGAILVSSESFWGHVSYVESVSDDSFVVSEMNYKGWGVTSRRSIPINSGIIRGFIY